MNLYDAMMERLAEKMEDHAAKVYTFDVGKTWPEHADFHMMFQKDMAYELGSGKRLGVNLTCVTSDQRFFAGDQVVVFGPELSEIPEGQEVSYARICEVLVREDEDEALKEEEGEAVKESEQIYKMLQDLDFVKYHVFPKGFMLRSSGQSHREQVRVGKEALREGISFEKIGNTIISHYKKLEQVVSVRMIFITERGMDFESLQKEAVLACEIRNSLSMLQKGLPTECGSCTIREICKEVEGLRELHFGKKKKDYLEGRT